MRGFKVLNSKPLDVETLNSIPFIKRGPWHVTWLDLDTNEERSFYVELMMEIGGSENLKHEGSWRI